MVYKIEFTNRSKYPIFLKDKEINYQTPITMFGKGTEEYGSIVWTNLLKYLENYCNSEGPNPALEGQLWYNVNTNNINVNVSKDMNSPKWEQIVIKQAADTKGLLSKSGDSISIDIQLTGNITDDNQVVTKQYVDNNRNINFSTSLDNMQYNLMNYNGYMTLNGTVLGSKFTDNKYTVSLPVEMASTNYIVMLTIGTKDDKIPKTTSYYVKNKTKKQFDIVVDDIDVTNEIQVSVVGYTKVD